MKLGDARDQECAAEIACCARFWNDILGPGNWDLVPDDPLGLEIGPGSRKSPTADWMAWARVFPCIFALSPRLKGTWRVPHRLEVSDPDSRPALRLFCSALFARDQEKVGTLRVSGQSVGSQVFK